MHVEAAQVICLNAQVASGAAGYHCKQRLAPFERLCIAESHTLPSSEMHFFHCAHILLIQLCRVSISLSTSGSAAGSLFV